MTPPNKNICPHCGKDIKEEPMTLTEILILILLIPALVWVFIIYNLVIWPLTIKSLIGGNNTL